MFCALVAGLLVASFVNGEPANSVAAVLQIVALLGAGYCLAHVFVVYVVLPRRARGARRAPREEYEDEVIYPDNPPTR